LLITFSGKCFLRNSALLNYISTSVAEPELEPEPVEQQLFAGVDFKNHNFVAIYFKEPFDDHLCL
jgi:hypothetical protein